MRVRVVHLKIVSGRSKFRVERVEYMVDWSPCCCFYSISIWLRPSFIVIRIWRYEQKSLWFLDRCFQDAMSLLSAFLNWLAILCTLCCRCVRRHFCESDLSYPVQSRRVLHPRDLLSTNDNVLKRLHIHTPSNE